MAGLAHSVKAAKEAHHKNKAAKTHVPCKKVPEGINLFLCTSAITEVRERLCLTNFPHLTFQELPPPYVGATPKEFLSPVQPVLCVCSWRTQPFTLHKHSELFRMYQ